MSRKVTQSLLISIHPWCKRYKSGSKCCIFRNRGLRLRPVFRGEASWEPRLVIPVSCTPQKCALELLKDSVQVPCLPISPKGWVWVPVSIAQKQTPSKVTFPGVTKQWVSNDHVWLMCAGCCPSGHSGRQFTLILILVTRLPGSLPGEMSCLPWRKRRWCNLCPLHSGRKCQPLIFPLEDKILIVNVLYAWCHLISTSVQNTAPFLKMNLWSLK